MQEKRRRTAAGAGLYRRTGAPRCPKLCGERNDSGFAVPLAAGERESFAVAGRDGGPDAGAGHQTGWSIPLRRGRAG